MKSLIRNMSMMAVAASMVLFTSCGEDDETPAPAGPTISVSTELNGTATTESPIQAEPEDEVKFNVDISSEGGFNVYRIFVSVDGAASTKIDEFTRLDLNVTAGTTSTTDSRTYEVQSSDVGSKLTFEFEVVDDNDQTATTTVEVEVNSPEARSYSTILLAAPTADTKNKNFFSVSAGETYSGDDVTSTSASVSPTIDFGYYYGNTEEASIASPKGFESTTFSSQVEGWGTKNNTTIKTTTMTAAQFLETKTYADIDAAYEAGTLDDNGIVNNLAEGTVLAFETVNGVKGLIHIAKIEPGFNSDDYVEINVLAQLEASAN